MFNLFKKKNENTAILSKPFEGLVTDMHSHILPGIDDGAKTVEDSKALINVLYQKGFRNFICTPHVYQDLYPNSTETIKAAFNTLLPVVNVAYPDVTINFAAEYFLDEAFDNKLEKNEKLLTVYENNVLIEHAFVQPPPDILTKVFNLQMAGYMPIYAHPERYEFYVKSKKSYHKLYDAGCLFQINLLSLIGYYGKAPMELAKYLIENKMVNLIGTDIHHDKHINAFQQFSDNKLFQELLKQGVLQNSKIK